MKKIILALCLVIAAILCLASCEEHTHVFAEDWSSDSDFHWHACEAIDGCPEVSDKEEHDFVDTKKNGKPVSECKVCKYTVDRPEEEVEEHDHKYSDELSATDNFHGYACKVKGCKAMKDKVEHAFDNPEVTYEDAKIIIKKVCVDCGYEKVETQKVQTEVDDEISWNDAFKGFKLTNFTMDIYFKSLDGDMNQHNHCVVTDDAVYYHIPGGREYYSVRNEDGTCTTYYHRYYDTGDTGFVRLESTEDSYLVGAQVETVLQISFEDNFDKFVYDPETGSYVCADPIQAEYFNQRGESYGYLYCYDSVVKLIDGKISYISAFYYFDEDEINYETKQFIYANIGMSAVEIPQSVINGAIPEEDASDYDESYGGKYEEVYPEE